jgi:hypothetical protein
MRARHRFTAALLLVLSLLALAAHHAQARTFSTRGRDFWLGFMSNFPGQATNLSLTVNITSDVATSGTVSIPALGWSKPFTIAAGGSALVDIPKTAYSEDSEKVLAEGVHVVADDSVSVYLLNYATASADAAVVIPTDVLGTDYLALCYGGRRNDLTFQTEMMVVAAHDGTTVEILPTATTAGGHPAGVPFTVILNAGEVYQVVADLDLTGTRVRAIPGEKGCRPFALFAGSPLTTVGECGYGDHLVEQMFPIETWGSQFVTVPYLTRRGDMFRIFAAVEGTHVSIDGGRPFTLAAGEHKDTTLEGAHTISADQPIEAAQLSRGTECDGDANADPFMILLSPLEQPLASTVFVAFTSSTIKHYYVNVVTRTGGTGSVRLDGASIAASFAPVPSRPAYSYAQLEIAQGVHTLSGDSGIIASVYGFGLVESYGYAAGLRLDPLPTSIVAGAPAMASDGSSICAGSPITLRGKGDPSFDRWSWDLGPFGIMEGREITAPFTVPGTYPVTLRVETGSGCAVRRDSVSAVVTVVEPPRPVIVAPGRPTLCDADSVILEADRDYASYLWSDGETGRRIVVRSYGVYTLTVTGDNGCAGTSAPFQVRGIRVPAPAVTVSCHCDSITLTASEGYASYRWSNGREGPSILLADPGSYAVTGFSEGGCDATSQPVVFDAVGPQPPILSVDPPLVQPAPGDTFALHLTARAPATSPLVLCPHTALRTTLAFDATLLAPLWADGADIIADTTVDGTRRLTLATASDADVMLYLTAALGSAVQTTVDAVEFGWNECPAAPMAALLSTVQMAGLCYQGDGIRLFSAGDSLFLKPVRPDPVSTIAEIDYGVIERGRTELFLVDGVGRRVASIVDADLEPGTYRAQADVSRLASGVYECILKTPTGLRERTVRVVR